MEPKKKIWCVDKLMLAMLIFYILGVIYVFISENPIERLSFFNIITLLLIISMSIAMATAIVYLIIRKK